MKKIVTLTLFFSFTPLFCALADTDDKKLFKEDPFSVSTSDLDSSDSLNRVAGDYDRGYSSPSQSYEVTDHAGSGPFAHEKAMTKESA